MRQYNFYKNDKNIIKSLLTKTSKYYANLLLILNPHKIVKRIIIESLNGLSLLLFRIN